jgi:hypothetical protein
MYTPAHRHFADFDDVPDLATLNKSQLPSGALILSLQAVGFCALCLATVYCSDHHVRLTILSAPKGFFSADVHGDGIRREAGSNGKMEAVHVNTASQYLPTIKALTLDHWTKIFDHVREILEQGKRRKRSKSVSSQVSSLADGYEEVETWEYILLSDN